MLRYVFPDKKSAFIQACGIIYIMKRPCFTLLFSWQRFSLLLILVLCLSFTGCLSTHTRNQPFTRDWQRQLDKGLKPNRRALNEEAKQSEEKSSGPFIVEKGPGGVQGVSVKGAGGFSADVEYRRRPAGWLRYRHHWDHGGRSMRQPRINKRP